jgi:small subunit ribosomal protein S1
VPCSRKAARGPFRPARHLKEGKILQGVVKNITDYGAFVDLGGVDGLLHVTDISWKRVNHPSEVLQIGQTIDVQVIRFNEETQRISLGMKQLENDPWEGVAAKYPLVQRFKGRVTNITDYGAFVELEEGIEGLVHVSEMSWTKKNVHPGKIVSTSQEVEVVVLDVDPDKRRISLGLKQCQENPWKKYADRKQGWRQIEGEVRNVTEFGLFVGLTDEIDGMVHLSDISWEDNNEEALKAFNKGDMVKAKILDMELEKERVALGIKQLTKDPHYGKARKNLPVRNRKKGEVVTCDRFRDHVGRHRGHRGRSVGLHQEVRSVARAFGAAFRPFRRRREGRRQGHEHEDKKGQLNLSIKAREIDEDKQAMKEFGSTESGASLGDILGAALGKKSEESSEEKPKAKKASKKKADDAEEGEEKPQEKKAKKKKKDEE